MQVWIAATMLLLNPDGQFNENELNKWYRRMEVCLHSDAAARNIVSLEEATAMFHQLGNARDIIHGCLQNNDHPLCPVDVQDCSDDE